MPLLLRQLARVMHPALSKKLYMEWRSQSQKISHLSAFFLYSAELASVPKHWPLLLGFVSEHYTPYTVCQCTQLWPVFGTAGSLFG